MCYEGSFQILGICECCQPKVLEALQKHQANYAIRFDKKVDLSNIVPSKFGRYWKIWPTELPNCWVIKSSITDDHRVHDVFKTFTAHIRGITSVKQNIGMAPFIED